MTGQLYLNYSQDVGLNSSGSLVIGDKNGINIGIDDNEIMARNNGVASTLYLNTEGGGVYYGTSSFSGKGDIIVSDGKKIQTNGIIVGYAYNGISNNNAAFVFDKPGTYWTGIGANGTADIIHFGPCNADGSWVASGTKTQKWDFQGSTTISGGIVSSHGHNFVVAGNEVNFIPDAFSNNNLWFNYDSFSRTNNSTIGNYCMGNGKHGYASVTATAHNTSSSRLIKENIEDMSLNEAQKIFLLKPVHFDYKEGFGQKNCYGFIAEDTNEIIPSVCTMPNIENEIELEDNVYKRPYPSIDYSKFIPYLIKVIQNQEERISVLEKK